MTMNPVEFIEAKSKLITAIGTSIAAILAGMAAFFSSQPSQAELPQVQLDAITYASENAVNALAMSKSNQIRLAALERSSVQNRPILGCAVRSFDTLFREHPTIIRPCPMNDLPE